MGKRNKSKGKLKSVASAVVGMAPAGRVAQTVAKLGIKAVGGVARAVKGRSGGRGGGFRGVRRRSLFSKVMRIRKQSIIEREKAKLNRIKLSAFR